ncbi:MAG: dienelactone hydrolase family protein [Microlunatus sp.]|nr:dienelactone hydrolase family protein [Microlunatus sp.]
MTEFAPDHRIEIATSDGLMPAQLWLPPAETGAAVVLFQEIFGVGRYIRARCADLAALGYVVLAPEIYWRLSAVAVDEDAEDALQQGVALAGRLDWERAVTDGVAAVRHARGLIEVTGDVGALGFCFGGGLAFNVAAVEHVDALVSYYGSALPQLCRLALRVDAPSLHHFGDADTYLPMDTVRTVESAVTTQPAVTVEIHPGAGHAFDNPAPMFHHAAASSAAWASTVRFLAEHLRSRAQYAAQ